MNIGIIGLGSMGLNLAKNIISKKYKVYAYEENPEINNDLKKNKVKDLFLTESLNELLNKVLSPRIIMLSLPADKVDEVINELTNFLEPEDIVADLGNSLYSKSIERNTLLNSHKINFLGVGVSGGPRGAKNGPAIMVGGSKEAWNKTKHIFEDIAAKNHNQSACCFFGSAGSGHFVKLVHNGIEYALMEGIAEVTNILDKVYNLNNDEIAKKFKDLLETNSSSFLLRITSEIINAKNENDQYFIDEVDPVIGQNGTGVWTIKAALDLGVGIPSIYEAVSARSNSKNFKYNFEQNFNNKKYNPNDKYNEISIEQIIFFNFACSIYQGLNLINESNKWDFFNFKIEDIFKAWSAGCILQGRYLDIISKEFTIRKKIDPQYLHDLIQRNCSGQLKSIREFNSSAINMGITCPVLSSNLAYYDQMFSNHIIGETIQLQRSFFGLHPIKDKKGKNKINPYWTKL